MSIVYRLDPSPQKPEGYILRKVSFNSFTSFNVYLKIFLDKVLKQFIFYHKRQNKDYEKDDFGESTNVIVARSGSSLTAEKISHNGW